MKTILLTGNALAISMAFSDRCRAAAPKVEELEAQLMALRKAVNKDMLDTVKAIKAELGMSPDSSIQVDATYAEEHGHAYVVIHDPSDEDASDFIHSSTPVVLN
jgi:hypothetical protein